MLATSGYAEPILGSVSDVLSGRHSGGEIFRDGELDSDLSGLGLGWATSAVVTSSLHRLSWSCHCL